jgi:glycogen(starch) synthase
MESVQEGRKMNILVISNLYPPHGLGGYEERCRQVVEGLKERDHKVTVLTSDYKNEGVASEETDVLRQLRINGFYGRPWLPIHKLYGLEKHNHAALQNALNTIRPDVVHVWNMGGISKSLLLRLEGQPVPLVYDISDHWIARSLSGDVWLSWWNDEGSGFRKMGRSLLQMTGIKGSISRKVPTASYRDLKFKRIYFCSGYMRDTTEGKGYPVGHAAVIYCGVEAEKFPVKTAYNSPQRLLWVGRLAEDKDPLTAVEAMGLLKEGDLSKCQLDIYGKGSEDYTRQLNDRVQQLGLEERVHFRFCTHGELRERYRDYDALLFTSNWGEPFALTPLEAMAAGLPVLLSPDGGDVELGRDGENCLLIEAANPASIVHALERLAALPDHGQAMAELAREELLRRYDMPVIVQQIEDYLEESIVQASG